MQIMFDKVSYIEEKCCKSEKVLDNISFTIEPKKIYAFVGNSGSGKTTICELIKDTAKQNSGEIKIYLNINHKEAQYKIGYVPKEVSELFTYKTVEKEFFAILNNYKNKELKSKNILKLAGLKEKYLKLNPVNLSLSEQRLLMLALVLVTNPKILILDEPTIGLKEKEKRNLIRLLKLLKNKYKKTILITSKDTDFVYNFVDYVYILDKGKIVKEGKKYILTDAKLLKRYKLKVPELVLFTSYMRKKGKKIKDYDNINDLIKGVYRSVK